MNKCKMFLNSVVRKVYLYYGYVIFIINLLVLLYLHQYINLYGDDFVYGTYTMYGFNKFISLIKNHYLHINGRAIVHILDSIILTGDIYVWRILNPFVISIIIYLIAKISCYNNKSNLNRSLVLTVFLFTLIEINILRESFYWLTGSLNYIYPVMLLLFLFYFSLNEITKERKCFYLPAIALFAGASTEQVGMMSIGCLFLLIFNCKINKKKVPFNLILSIFLCILGYLTVIFSPGTFNRVNNEGNYSIKTGILNLFYFNFIFKDMNIFIIILMCCSCIVIDYIFKKNKFIKLLYKLQLINIFTYMIIVIFTKEITLYGNKVNKNIKVCQTINELLDLKYTKLYGKITYIILISICGISLLTYILICLNKANKEKNIIILISLILALGSQLMMIVTSTMGGRTLVPTICIMFIIFTNIICNANIRDKNFLLLFTLVIINSRLSFLIITEFILLIMLYSKRESHTSNYIITVIVILTFLVPINSKTNEINGYKENYVIYKYNINQILKYKSDTKSEILLLKKDKNELYKEIIIYNNDYLYNYYTGYIKEYYRLPSDAKIFFY